MNFCIRYHGTYDNRCIWAIKEFLEDVHGVGIIFRNEESDVWNIEMEVSNEIMLFWKNCKWEIPVNMHAKISPMSWLSWIGEELMDFLVCKFTTRGIFFDVFATEPK